MSQSSTQPKNQPSKKQPGLVGRYQYLGEMGMGSMADVIKAYDPRIDRILAIKLIRHQYSDDENYKQLFIQEAKAAGNLSHPNIVTIYDVGEFQGKPYLAMELLKGRTLEQQMEENPFDSIEKIVDIAIQATEAIKYAHQQGVIHRDIKAANLIYDNDSGLVKILDFGIAHFEKHKIDVTDEKMVVGTPEYMSPEQLLKVSTDQRTDLYALGVLFYFMLARTLPFEAENNQKLFNLILANQPTPLKAKVENVPTVFVDLIGKLLKKDLEQRVQSADELLESLNETRYQIRHHKKQQKKHKFIPLRFKWTVIMVSVVALVMSIGVITVNHLQYKAMTNIVFDHGGSLMSMIAVESAEDLLIEDYVAVQTLVEDLQRQQTFLSLTIVDRHNLVRGSHDSSLINKPYKDDLSGTKVYEDTNIKVTDTSTTKDELIFKFTSPIYYRDKQVGQAYLGLAQDALTSASTVTAWMMIVLMLVTLLTVVLGIYLLTYRLTRPLMMLNRALDKVFSGNYSTRIPVNGNDELSLLYRSFNRMVEHLEKKTNSQDVNNDEAEDQQK